MEEPVTTERLQQRCAEYRQDIYRLKLGMVEREKLQEREQRREKFDREGTTEVTVYFVALFLSVFFLYGMPFSVFYVSVEEIAWLFSALTAFGTVALLVTIRARRER